MNDTHYTQCKMMRGSSVHTAWIPASFAKKGRVLRLKFNGEWNNGWVVKEVYNSMSAKHVESHMYDYKHQRESSDI